LSKLLAEDLLDSQEGFCAMELVCQSVSQTDVGTDLVLRGAT